MLSPRHVAHEHRQLVVRVARPSGAHQNTVGLRRLGSFLLSLYSLPNSQLTRWGTEEPAFCLYLSCIHSFSLLLMPSASKLLHLLIKRLLSAPLSTSPHFRLPCSTFAISQVTVSEPQTREWCLIPRRQI